MYSQADKALVSPGKSRKVPTLAVLSQADLKQRREIRDGWEPGLRFELLKHQPRQSCTEWIRT